MPSHMRQRKALELNDLGHPLESFGAEDKTDKTMNKVAVHTSDNSTAASTELTLDDFGGRSDALGG